VVRVCDPFNWIVIDRSTYANDIARKALARGVSSMAPCSNRAGALAFGNPFQICPLLAAMR
jgi:hypothetical protein